MVSSGALGFDGKGYWWEQPFRWFGLLRPQEFTIVTKTLTLHPRKGNLKWYAPWKAVRLIKGGVVNSVGLSNPGLPYWIKKCSPKLKYNTVVSITPFDVNEASQMTLCLNGLTNIKGIEVNLSCPSTEPLPIEILDAVVDRSAHPVIVKLDYNAADFVRKCNKYSGKKLEALSLINSVPWSVVFPDKESPIRPCSGVSGEAICKFARDALNKVKRITETPIISGGGIYTIEEMMARFVMGAQAVSFGSLFLKKPWKPNSIVADFKKRTKK